MCRAVGDHHELVKPVAQLRRVNSESSLECAATLPEDGAAIGRLHVKVGVDGEQVRRDRRTARSGRGAHLRYPPDSADSRPGRPVGAHADICVAELRVPGPPNRGIRRSVVDDPPPAPEDELPADRLEHLEAVGRLDPDLGAQLLAAARSREAWVARLPVGSDVPLAGFTPARPPAESALEPTAAQLGGALTLHVMEDDAEVPADRSRPEARDPTLREAQAEMNVVRLTRRLGIRGPLGPPCLRLEKDASLGIALVQVVGWRPRTSHRRPGGLSGSPQQSGSKSE
jgi:hypothetical protein